MNQFTGASMMSTASVIGHVIKEMPLAIQPRSAGAGGGGTTVGRSIQGRSTGGRSTHGGSGLAATTDTGSTSTGTTGTGTTGNGSLTTGATIAVIVSDRYTQPVFVSAGASPATSKDGLVLLG
jgi:hypothetical protein